MAQREPRRPVLLTHSPNLSGLFDLLPANANRQTLVTSLIEAYGLHTQTTVIPVVPCTRAEVERFHDPEFVAQLLRKREPPWTPKRLQRTTDKEVCGGEASVEEASEEEAFEEEAFEEEASEEEASDSEPETVLSSNSEQQTLLRFGLSHDSPVFPHLRDYVRYVTGLTVSAARALCRATPETIAINWYGGRHHGRKGRAAGFCYVNDIVLGIMELRRKYRRVAYIDLDLHHGDGVEAAFRFSNKVLTVSIHRLEVGFYPGTGSSSEIGTGRGQGFSVNIPTQHGLTDDNILELLRSRVLTQLKAFDPECLVVQCGCDGLSTDDHQEWNLTTKGFGEAVGLLLNLKKPTLLLGGGGYNNLAVARCWTYLTAVALGEQQQALDWEFIPEHLMVEEYEADGYRFWVDEKRNMRNDNDLQSR